LIMNADEKAALLKRYSDRLAKYGPTIEALGWNKPKHKLRFKILLEYWLRNPSPQNLRVLDFGCGFGDLFGYAQEHQLKIDYTGLDINPDLIDVARQKNPAVRFLCHDPFEQPLDEKFDVVLSSGVHNYQLKDNRKFTEQCFEWFDHHSTLGFSVNFLSNHVNIRNEQNYYSAPEEMLALAMRYSSRVVIRHDYMPFEFTVVVDKRNDIDEKLTVYLPFAPDCTE
jgi:SAM-dependent methyltransferase